METKTFDRQDSVLTAALNAFFRFGYKKTSMDDIAKAAGMTRQGVYFHYRSKDELLRAAIQRALDDGESSVQAALSPEGLPLQTRLFRVMDAWFGSYVGRFNPEMISDWEFHCHRVMGDAVDRSNAMLRQRLKELILTQAISPSLQAQAGDAADILFLCGQTWKRTLTSYDEFSAKLQSAISLCCRE